MTALHEVLLVISIFFGKFYAEEYYVGCGNCIKTSSSQVCKVKELEQGVYPGQNEITASKPKLLDVSHYTYLQSNNITALALNLTWSHSGRRFNHSTGYVLSIKPQSSIDTDILKFSINFKDAPLYNDEVIMNYPCYGRRRLYQSIKPNHLYHITLQSLPAYHDNTKRNNNEISKSYFTAEKIIHHLPMVKIMNKSKDGSSSKATPDKAKISVTDIEITPLVCSFFISFSAASLVFLCLLKTFYSRFIGHKKSPVMFLISTFDKEDDQDHQYLKAADMLCDILKQLGAVDVITNVWNDVNISEPLEWFDESVKNCKHIVLVCTPLGKKNWMKKNMNDMFVMGYQMYRKQKIKKRWFSSSSHKFSLVCFDANSKACIPNEMDLHKIKHIHNRNQISSFFTELTRKRLHSSSKNLSVDLSKFIKI